MACSGTCSQGGGVRLRVITHQCYQTSSASQLITTTDDSNSEEVPRGGAPWGGAYLLAPTTLQEYLAYEKTHPPRTLQ